MRAIILILFSISLFSAEYDSLLLRAQASIFPKIMLLDNDISNKINDKELVLSIVYEDTEYLSAKKFKKMIDSEHKNSLGDLIFESRLVNIKDFNTKQTSAAYYVFDTRSSDIKKVISHAKDTQRICFGYNYKDFDENILISLFVKEKMYIYLNKSVLQDYDIKFTPIFYKIVKVVE